MSRKTIRLDEPMCHQIHDDAEYVYRVSNQPDEYDSTRNHSSVWVCGERPCLLDAMAYVERQTGERAQIRDRASKPVTA